MPKERGEERMRKRHNIIVREGEKEEEEKKGVAEKGDYIRIYGFDSFVWKESNENGAHTQRKESERRLLAWQGPVRRKEPPFVRQKAATSAHLDVYQLTKYERRRVDNLWRTPGHRNRRIDKERGGKWEKALGQEAEEEEEEKKY